MPSSSAMASAWMNFSLLGERQVGGLRPGGDLAEEAQRIGLVPPLLVGQGQVQRPLRGLARTRDVPRGEESAGQVHGPGR